MKRFTLLAAVMASVFAFGNADARLVTKAVPFVFQSTAFNGLQAESLTVSARSGQLGAVVPDTSAWVSLANATINAFVPGTSALTDSVLAIRWLLVNAGTATTSANLDTFALVPQFSLDNVTPLASPISAAVGTISGASLPVGQSICLQFMSTYAGIGGTSNPTTVALQKFMGYAGARLIINTWDSTSQGTKWRLYAQYVVPDATPLEGSQPSQ